LRIRDRRVSADQKPDKAQRQKRKPAPSAKKASYSGKESGVVLIGSNKRVAELVDVFNTMCIPCEITPWPADLNDIIAAETIGVLVAVPVAPRTRVKTAEVLQEIRRHEAGQSLPVACVVPNNAGDKDVNLLYRAGASAVFKWPGEAANFPSLMAEILGMSLSRGKADNADKALARTIRAHLKTQQIYTSDLRVSVRGGIASISGAIGSLWKKIRIIHMVEQVPGITGVISNGLYVPHSGIPDKRIRKSVMHVLNVTLGYDNASIDASIHNGVVAIEGKVANPDEYRRILDIISHVDGVRGIRRYNAVRGPGVKKRPKTLTQSIVWQLATIWPGSPISVNVFEDTVVLAGQTDTLARRREIVESIEQQEGVGRVVNKIHVTHM
jgi:osmotically-inducible protein OsmY